eukprot:scaffold154580_cov14-Tisochrysis_lutea.AAC.1
MPMSASYDARLDAKVLLTALLSAIRCIGIAATKVKSTIKAWQVRLELLLLLVVVVAFSMSPDQISWSKCGRLGCCCCQLSPCLQASHSLGRTAPDLMLRRCLQ